MIPRHNQIYGSRIRPRLDTGTEGGAKQSFRDEVNINNIVDKYARTGQLPVVAQASPKYVDCSRIPDFAALQYHRAALEQAFAELPESEQDIYGDALTWLESHDQDEGVPEGTPEVKEPPSGSQAAEGEPAAEAQLPS